VRADKQEVILGGLLAFAPQLEASSYGDQARGSVVAGRSIGDILVSLGVVTEQQVQDAVEKQSQLRQRKRLGDLLVSMGYITERDRVKALAVQWGVPFAQLADLEISPQAARVITAEVARRFKVVPISIEGKKLTLAMKNPLDIFAIDEIRLISGLDVEPIIATEQDILNTINLVYRANQSETPQAVFELIEGLDAAAEITIAGTDSDEDINIDELKELTQDSPIVQLANMIVTRAIEEGASDIHLEPTKDCLKVRYRIDGILHDVMTIPRRAQFSLISRVKIMSEMDIAEKRAPQDGRFAATIHGGEYDFRVSSLPAIYGEKVVLRILDKSSITVGLDKLGLSPELLPSFRRSCSSTHGIILVTGPTGSGKSTTLYSVLGEVSSGEKNILTLEDPVEYELAGITQANVNPRAGLTFATGLRCMLRQDPNIIMVGEIRDKETAVIAVEAALTGHLVLSTLHTNDAPSAVTRLLDMGTEAFLISSSVIGVLAQRLLRTICPKCKEQYNPPAEILEKISLCEAAACNTFYRGRGCEVCRGTGYKGRMGTFEYMAMSDSIREKVLARESAHVIRQTAIEEGMRTLRDDAVDKISKGLTTIEEALRVIYAG
jgi:type IV pilus assembly protein PilB